VTLIASFRSGWIWKNVVARAPDNKEGEIMHHLLMLEGKDPDLVGIGSLAWGGDQRSLREPPCQIELEEDNGKGMVCPLLFGVDG
jgi:hypothetical protein